jgi:cytochrome c553
MPIINKGERKNRAVYNILFILLCLAILLFLLNAPKETTAKLPHDAQHARFQAMNNNKEAEKFCGECHSPNGQAPLQENHPPKFRCLFCHKTR